ncbi:MAG: hypothetical protein HYT79_02110 [Elusimicrobia bacterium]|nr:hypothetical protein [Elusimicrobiota bacterium]
MDALTVARLKMLKNWARQVRANRWEFFKVVSIVLFGLLLIGCLHWWFYRALVFVDNVPAIGHLLMKKLFEIAFLSSFSLIALSAMVTSLATHFGSSDLPLLLSFPIHQRRVFFQKAFEAMIHASWMITLVLLPFLMVLVKIKELDYGFLVLAFVLFFPFSISASSIGIALSSLFVAVFPRRKLTELLSVLGVLVFVFLYSGIRLTLPQRLIRPDQMEDVFQYILYLQAPAGSFLPSRWFVEAMGAYMAGDWNRLVFSAGILFAFGALSLALLAFLGTKVLTLAKWSQVLEGGHDSISEESGAADGPPPLSGAKTLGRLLLLKEIRFFLRDSQRFSNVSFILAVCAIYLVSIYRLPMDTPQLKNFVSFINLALGLFIIGAISLRFCFPQPSLELYYAWIIKASPMGSRELLGSKLIFNLVFLNVIGAVLVCVSPWLLGTDMRLIPIYLAASFLTSCVMSVLSLAVGSAFPKTRFENIIQIETSFGGFLYAVFILGFMVITLSVFAMPIRFFFQVRYMNYAMGYYEWVWLGVLLGGHALFSAVICAVSWFAARRSWERYAP